MIRARWWMAVAWAGATACEAPTGNTVPGPSADAFSGGVATVFDATGSAFGHPAPTLSSTSLAHHGAGDAAFEAAFVTAPAPVNPGLGPLFNSSSCAGCHTGDGRGRPPNPGEVAAGFLVRLSLPGITPQGGPVPVPGFGGQLQQRAIQGVSPEADLAISYVDSAGVFVDGTPYALRVPQLALLNPYAGLPGGLLTSPRAAPPVFGLGLLEAVPEQEILQLADETDQDGDGISGRPNYVYDMVSRQTMLGRFGLKANTPNLLQQAFVAYNEDIGVTTSYLPAENCEGQIPACATHPPELRDSVVQAVTFYLRTLAVPARRALDDSTARHGEALFAQLRCSACHQPTLQTGGVLGVPELSNQTIHPYTDLLLHDMGPGLADGRPDFLATGSEWRTPPLWGIGLTAAVNGHTTFLHDGRARSLIEAILWHDGEAHGVREAFRALSAADREALIAFLRSL
jgi:CxxC motif-containing protein (DUF1111 family)